MDPAVRDAMLRRGEALLMIGDISGARRFLERAADGGSAAAAMAMAETYDPALLASRGVIGLPADRSAALDWYRRALTLGANAAAARIFAIEATR
jgi:TPR repeat protein